MKNKKLMGKKMINVFFTVILVLLITVIAVTLIVRVSGNTPSIGGYMIFRVSTGSMEPELHVGDVILTKELKDISEIHEGDIVTYEGREGELAGKLITHKVITAPYTENGTTYLVTKGIANPAADSAIQAEQVIGKMELKIPFIGALYSFFLTPWGLVTAIFAILLAFSGEFWNIYKLSRSKKTEDVSVDAETVKNAVELYKRENKISDKNCNTDEKNT